MDNETVFLKREALYKMVWSEPVSKLAQGYGLSDRGLGKICKRLEIPVPGRGYWQMKKKGLQIPVPPLRPTKKLNATGAYIHRTSKPRIDSKQDHETCDLITAEKLPENKITVPPSLDSPPSLFRLKTCQLFRKLDLYSAQKILFEKKPILSALVPPLCTNLDSVSCKQMNLFKC